MTVLNELRIPRMGSVENAKLVSWRVAEGAAFVAGQVLCDVETDKTLAEVEADADGIFVRRLAAEGSELKVGDLIGLTTAPGVAPALVADALDARDRTLQRHSRDSGSAPGAAAALASNVSRPEAASSLQLSPLVRRLAKEHAVDLSRVTGTGPGGRITGDDVLKFATSSEHRASESSAPAPAAVPGYDGVPVEATPLSTRRRAIARRLAESARTAPQLTADMQVDMSALLAARTDSKAARGDRPVSILALIAHATARLLTQHRDLNATFTDTHFLRWRTVNLGIAVDTADGLVVPVIRGAEQRSLEEIDAAVSDLAERARAGTLEARELDGGTFTISNPGSIGPVLRAEAILNPPQVALLGLPAMIRAPVAIEVVPGKYLVEVRPLLKPSLTFDHRALDGGQVIRFLNDLKRALESL